MNGAIYEDNTRIGAVCKSTKPLIRTSDTSNMHTHTYIYIYKVYITLI